MIFVLAFRNFFRLLSVLELLFHALLTLFSLTVGISFRNGLWMAFFRALIIHPYFGFWVCCCVRESLSLPFHILHPQLLPSFLNCFLSPILTTSFSVFLYRLLRCFYSPTFLIRQFLPFFFLSSVFRLHIQLTLYAFYAF